MGLIRFLVPDRQRLPATATKRAYLTGMDEVPWSCHVIETDEGFNVVRAVDDSGCFHIPWQVEGYGETTLSTATLMERERPYLLEVELARGTINRVRNRLAEWAVHDLQVPEAMQAKLGEAIATFSRAVVAQSDAVEAGRIAQEALAQILPLTTEIARTFADAMIKNRRKTTPQLTTLLGADMGNAAMSEPLARGFLDAFNTAVVPMSWHDIEVREGEKDWSRTDAQIDWCTANGLRICGGPLLKFDRASVPDWLYLWEGDEETIFSLMIENVRERVARYRQRVHVWQCASRLITGSLLGLSQEQRMRMTIRAVEVARQIDGQTPMVVTFDQPWGEHAARNEMDLPLHFADALTRSNMGLAGIGLEINLAYHPGGTLHRNAMEFSRQLDRWAVLGLPLMVSLAVPSGTTANAGVRRPDELSAGSWTAERQAEWTRDFLPIILSKPSVQAVVWNQLRDDIPHDFACGGLVDAAGNVKPALAQLAATRGELLM